jgi:hypothetical protein
MGSHQPGSGSAPAFQGMIASQDDRQVLVLKQYL